MQKVGNALFWYDLSQALVTLTIRLQTLAGTSCGRAGYREQIASFVKAYRSRPSQVPPIPIRLNKHGQIRLDRDGNHRLQAAREAGLEVVRVELDARDVARLMAIDAISQPRAD